MNTTVKIEPIRKAQTDHRYMNLLRITIPIALLVIIGCYLLSGMLKLDAIPRSFGDEAWYAMPSVELIRNGKLRTPAIHGRGGIDRAYVQPKVIPNLVAAPVIWCFGISLWTFRMTSLLMGLVSIIFVYRFSRLLFDDTIAVISTLFFFSNFWFFMVCRTFRPESFEIAFIVAFTYYLTHTVRTKSRFSAISAGISAAFAALTHQIAGMMVLLIGAVVVISEFRSYKISLATATMVVGAALLTIVPYIVYVLAAIRDPAVSFFQQLSGEATVEYMNASGVIMSEVNRWSNFLMHPYGTITAIPYAASVAFSFRRSSNEDRMLGWICIGITAMMLLIPIKTGRYLVLIIPFMAILLSRLVLRTPKRILPFMGCTLALVYLLPMLVIASATSYYHKNADYSKIAGLLRQRIPEYKKVAGPVAFWLAFNTQPFVTTNVDEDSFDDQKGREVKLEAKLIHEKPDYVINTTTSLQSTDGLGPRPEKFADPAYQSFLSGHGVLIDTIPSRDFGPVQIWQMKWNSL